MGQSGLASASGWHTFGSTLRLNVGSQTRGTAALSVVLAVPDSYVIGVNVCTSDTGSTSTNTVQGIRLFQATYANGSLTRVGNAEAQETPACARWHDRQNCPSGTVATGVKLHHSGDYVRGVALRCTPVR